MISVRNLTKIFDGRKVLDNISVDYKPGECSMIIGASGSGKTVLLKSIVGLFEPDEGDVYFDDIIFNRLPFDQKKSVRSKIGMLFQGNALFDFASVEGNIRFPMDFFTDWSMEQKIDRVNFCLKRVNLEGINKKMPSELSGGMQKRVAIARAIALNPQYLFCDEPNSGLDPQTSVVIDHLIKEITVEYNITTIVNTHDMSSILEIGDKIGFIYEGRLMWEGDKTNILDSGCEELNSFVLASAMAKRLISLRNGI